MKILAIDSSGMVASVAVLTEGKLMGEYTINNKKTHSQTLLPMIDELVNMLELDLKEIDAIAIAAGPGSFTGLRIGSATVKGLAFSLDKPIISVPTLEGLAYNLFGTKELICSIMDARNQQVFAGMYRFQGGILCTELDQCPITVDELIEKVNARNVPTIFVGDGVDAYKEQLEEKITVPMEFAPCHLSKQRASAIGIAGMKRFQEGKIDTADSHVPEYLRLSQAEREMQERKAREAAKKES